MMDLLVHRYHYEFIPESYISDLLSIHDLADEFIIL